ncbi:MAG: cyclic nucleotide-binding domain-containing protein [Emergencia sp.]
MKVRDQALRAAYISRYPVQQYFGVPVEEYLEVHLFRKGEYVFEEQTVPQRLFFLKEGRVQLYLIHQDGNVSLAQYYGPGDVLGELELLGMRSQAQSIQAVEDTVCIGLPFESCREILLSDSVFLLHLSRFIAGKMLRGVGKLVSTQTYPLEYRLAAYLLEREAGEAEEPGGWMNIRLTDLSQYLGASYRHLSRVVKQFDEAGWICKERTRLRITDREALKEKVSRMETE